MAPALHGTVSLGAEFKGINLSRIVRTSFELAEYARHGRGCYAVPHSQRNGQLVAG